MKKIIVIALALFCTGCNKWLEVDNDTNAPQERLFADYQGYRSAVNGVYLLLSEPTLYAQALTWGQVSVLGNNYDASTASDLPKQWKNLMQQPYTSPDSEGLLNPIWESGYNVIANCNNILVNIENTDDSFFPSTARERDVIMGEMLGVRAMMHLDLLRLYAPAVDDGKVYIPYHDAFPVQTAVPLTVKQTLGRIIADLTRATELLKFNDTEDEINREQIQTAERRFHALVPNADRFMTLRGLRMNYFAAQAILARAHQWNGDLESAANAAQKVLDYGPSGEQTWFWFTYEDYLNWKPDYFYNKLYDDILFAGYNVKLPKNYTDAVRAGESMRLTFSKATDPLWNGDADDFRLFYLQSGTANKLSERWTLDPAAKSQDVVTQAYLAPVVRMSECYYIICEYLADTDLPKANEMLGEVRLARGSKTPINYTTKAEFMDALVIEMTREFQTEGQTFFLYKRLNRPLYNGANPMNMTGRWVLPMPRSENEYI